MKRIKSYCTSAFLLASACLGSCVKDNGLAVSQEGALSIVPSVFTGVTKAADSDADINAGDEVDSRDELRENFFSSLDIFVKKSDAPENSAWFKTYHLNANDPGVVLDPDKYDSGSLLDKAKQILAASWGEEGFDPREKYDIYVTANNPKTALGVAPANLTALKALSTYEYNIFRYYYDSKVERWNSHMREPKQFLMDGVIKSWQIKSSAKEQVFDVGLQRAAAKIIVNLRYGDEKRMDLVSEDGTQIVVGGVLKERLSGDIPDKGSIKEYFELVGREPGTPRWKYVNFAFKTADIADGNYIADLDDSGNGDAQEAIQTYSSNFDAEKIPADAGKQNVHSTYSIVTYSYPVDWSSDNSKAPCILLAVSYTNKNNIDDSRLNYYRIPVCDERAVTSLERNHIYVVDVDIASLGSSSSPLEQNDSQLRIEYHVIPWTEEAMEQHATTTVVAGDTKYLMVTPTSYILKGNDVQTTNLQWFASVAKDDGRIVDIDANTLNVSYVNYLGNRIDIKGSVSKTTLADGTIQITSTAPSGSAAGEKLILQVLPTGFIRVLSEALSSRAVKDISFTVRLNNTTLSEVVNITHFPLDNIQSIEGWWSSKVTNLGTGGVVKTSSTAGKKLEFSDANPGAGWTRYTVNGQYRWFREVNATVDAVTTRWILFDQTGQNGQVTSNTASGDIFAAKVVRFHLGTGDNTKQITRISVPTNATARPGYGAVYSNLTNNQMYVIQTTATSNKYALGRPVLNSSYQSQDKCVSPAFMIASQLGAVTATSSPTLAATHCGTYMEVGVDGTHYLGWRLPTGAEIGTILEYQNNPGTNGKTIVEVLGGAYYWALDGRAYSKADGSVYVTSGSNYVRCVRDLSLEEVEKLNNHQ